MTMGQAGAASPKQVGRPVFNNALLRPTVRAPAIAPAIAGSWAGRPRAALPVPDEDEVAIFLGGGGRGGFVVELLALASVDRAHLRQFARALAELLGAAHLGGGEVQRLGVGAAQRAAAQAAAEPAGAPGQARSAARRAARGPGGRRGGAGGRGEGRAGNGDRRRQRRALRSLSFCAARSSASRRPAPGSSPTGRRRRASAARAAARGSAARAGSGSAPAWARVSGSASAWRRGRGGRRRRGGAGCGGSASGSVRRRLGLLHCGVGGGGGGFGVAGDRLDRRGDRRGRRICSGPAARSRPAPRAAAVRAAAAGRNGMVLEREGRRARCGATSEPRNDQDVAAQWCVDVAEAFGPSDRARNPCPAGLNGGALRRNFDRDSRGSSRP